jgi:hypothetical protein
LSSTFVKSLTAQALAFAGRANEEVFVDHGVTVIVQAVADLGRARINRGDRIVTIILAHPEAINVEIIFRVGNQTITVIIQAVAQLDDRINVVHAWTPLTTSITHRNTVLALTHVRQTTKLDIARVTQADVEIIHQAVAIVVHVVTADLWQTHVRRATRHGGTHCSVQVQAFERTCSAGTDSIALSTDEKDFVDLPTAIIVNTIAQLGCKRIHLRIRVIAVTVANSETIKVCVVFIDRNLTITVIIQAIANFTGNRATLTAGVEYTFVNLAIAVIVQAVANFTGNCTTLTTRVCHFLVHMTITVIVLAITHLSLRYAVRRCGSRRSCSGRGCARRSRAGLTTEKYAIASFAFVRCTERHETVIVRVAACLTLASHAFLVNCAQIVTVIQILRHVTTATTATESHSQQHQSKKSSLHVSTSRSLSLGTFTHIFGFEEHLKPPFKPKLPQISDCVEVLI